MPIKSKPPAGRQRRERARGSPRPPRSPKSPVASWGWSFGTLGTWVHAPGYRSYMAGRTWSLNCSPSLEQAAGQALNLASRGRAPNGPTKSPAHLYGTGPRRDGRAAATRDPRFGQSDRTRRSHAPALVGSRPRAPGVGDPLRRRDAGGGLTEPTAPRKQNQRNCKRCRRSMSSQLWQGARSKAPPRLRFGIPQDPHGAAPRAVSSIRWSQGGNVGVRLRIYERETVPWRDKRSSIASRSTSTHSALQRARASA